MDARALGVKAKLGLVAERLKLLEELVCQGQVFDRALHLRQAPIRTRALHRSIQRALRHLLDDVRQVEANSVVPRRDHQRFAKNLTRFFQVTVLILRSRLVQHHIFILVEIKLALSALVELGRLHVLRLGQEHVALVDENVRVDGTLRRHALLN